MVFPGKVGITSMSPRNTAQRGAQLDEAIGEKLRLQWLHSIRPGDPFPYSYGPQIQVLEELQRLIAQENNVTLEETFTLFVKAKHNPNDYRNLIEIVCGRYKTDDGRVKFRRKDFYRDICRMMNQEDNNNPNNDSAYPHTLEYISSATRNVTE